MVAPLVNGTEVPVTGLNLETAPGCVISVVPESSVAGQAKKT